jgi:GrpE
MNCRVLGVLAALILSGLAAGCAQPKPVHVTPACARTPLAMHLSVGRAGPASPRRLPSPCPASGSTTASNRKVVTGMGLVGSFCLLAVGIFAGGAAAAVLGGRRRRAATVGQPHNRRTRPPDERDGHDRTTLIGHLIDLRERLANLALIHKVDSALAAVGVEPIVPAPGARFDPEAHRAVGAARASDTAADWSIGEVMTIGHRDRGVVLRPAEVIVLRSGS